MNFFLIFATALLLIGSLYISFRLIPRTSLQGGKKIFAYILCFSPLVNIPARYASRIFARAGEPIPPWLDITVFTSYILIGSLSVLATVVFVVDIFLLCKRFIHKKKQSTLIKPALNTDRRLFLQNSLSAGIVLTGGALVAYGASEAMCMPAVRHVSVPVRNLPAQFQGFTIAHLTDLHINKPIPPTRLENIVNKVNALNADIIVITGDLSDSFPAQVRTEMDPLRHLTARHGKYFVSGNHEYYTNIEAWLEEVARLELTNLHNTHNIIEQQNARLLVCGVPDINAPRISKHISSPILAQEGSQKDDIKILLAHQPQSIYEGVKVGYHVQISGHTHGGQLFPWTYVTDWVQPYIHGLYQVEQTQLYVSRGTGYWGPPVRNGAPAEIAFLKLVDTEN